jgi:ligand-binding SRPBCC domain-containing protein
MTELHEVTILHAPIERCFDLARSIEVHLLGSTGSGEQATAGTCTGLMNMGESVTWRARHFLIRQHLTSAITAFDRPSYFQDTMLRGAFASMQHDHFFRPLAPDTTEMRDDFRFAAPLGPLGLIAERLVLGWYMTAFLRERNAIIKQVAESEEWRKYLPTE